MRAFESKLPRFSSAFVACICSLREDIYRAQVLDLPEIDSEAALLDWLMEKNDDLPLKSEATWAVRTFLLLLLSCQVAFRYSSTVENTLHL